MDSIQKGIFLSLNYEFNDRVLSIFDNIKRNEYKGSNFSLPIFSGNGHIATLFPVTVNDLGITTENQDMIRLFAKWREADAKWYPTVFKVTEEGTKNWLETQVVGKKDRILFIIKTPDGVPIGHMGLYRGEVDNILRGRKDILKGIMTHSLNTLMKWAFYDLSLDELHLQVFSDNMRAISLYNRCEFKEVGRIPMRLNKEGTIAKWEEMPVGVTDKASRFLIIMQIDKSSIR